MSRLISTHDTVQIRQLGGTVDTVLGQGPISSNLALKN